MLIDLSCIPYSKRNSYEIQKSDFNIIDPVNAVRRFLDIMHVLTLLKLSWWILFSTTISNFFHDLLDFDFLLNLLFWYQHMNPFQLCNSFNLQIGFLGDIFLWYIFGTKLRCMHYFDFVIFPVQELKNIRKCYKFAGKLCLIYPILQPNWVLL